MNYNFPVWLIAILLVISCSRPQKPAKLERREFRTEVMLPMTPVKDQQTDELGWLYAMLATIETEHIGRGDSVNLSPAYVARMLLQEQVDRSYLSSQSILANDDGEVYTMTLSGTLPQLVRLIQTYGLMPYDSYHSDSLLQVAAAKLEWMIATEASQGKSILQVRQDAAALLDNAINPLPRHVYMYRMEYTPLEFAHSVCMPDEYVAVTSLAHEPMYRRVPLPVLENRDNALFLNLPLDRMMRLIERSVRGGHPVCWQGNMDEDVFSQEEGVGDVAKGKRRCTQQQRQRAFEQNRFSHDHAMAIIGIARSKDGRPFFVCKDSRGTKNPYGGLVYLSFDYVRMYTTTIMLNAIAM